MIGEAGPDDYIADAAGRRPQARARRNGPSGCRHNDHRHLPKAGDAQAKIAETQVTINGIAKGSGMIAPDMATMLAFIFTDAKIPAPVLQRC